MITMSSAIQPPPSRLKQADAPSGGSDHREHGGLIAFVSPVRRRLRLCIIAAALVLLAGCSAVRLVYNQGQTIAFWWLDGYFDFDAEQGVRAREALSDWFRWHRATQLPEYAGLLAQAQRQILNDITPGEVCRWSDELRKRLETAYLQGVPALADLLRTLTPAQVRHVEKRYQKADEDFRGDFLQATRAEQLETANRRTVSRAETIYGRLDDAQRKLIADGIAASPFDARRWLLERQARQREIVDTLRTLQAAGADPGRAEAALRVFALHATVSPRPAYREYQQRLFDYNCALVARLHNTTSAEQRRHGAARLKGWEEDLHALAAQRHPEPERDRLDRP
jgi:hypothetical protein